jgi:serine/threonine protein kinase
MAYTNWKEQGNPFLDFTEEITYEWMRNGFDKQQARVWLNIEMKAEDAGFCAWLRDKKKIIFEQILDNEERLRKEYKEYAISFLSSLSKEVVEKIKNFKHSCDYHHKLTSEQQSLINKLIPDQELRNRYIEYGLCSECQQPNTNLKLCQSCNVQHLQLEFRNWTSGNQEIDEFIQKLQLNSSHLLGYPKKVLEWIPYEQFENIEYLADGGFSKVYKAEQKTHLYGNDKTVVLKSLYGSQDITADFLQEVANHKLTSAIQGSVVNCLGISQDPATNNYLMVMEYMKEGSLRKYLQSNREDFEDKFRQLYDIAIGLNFIHQQGLVHRDFHSGNILKNILEYDAKCYITDLGLCRPVSEKDNSKVYGILPYMAPEVLKGKIYTQTSDIYSFGIVIYEYVSGLSPYYNVLHDVHLAKKIMKGLRPNLDEVAMPQLLKDLVRKCWDADPSKRPIASVVKDVLGDWFIENRNKKNTEFHQQCKLIKETEEKEFYEFCKQHENMDYNKAREIFYKSPSTSYKTHPQVIYTSRLLDFKNLPEPQNSKEINEQFWNPKNNNISQSVEFDLEELDQDLREQEQLQSHQEILPK